MTLGTGLFLSVLAVCATVLITIKIEIENDNQRMGKRMACACRGCRREVNDT